MVMQKNYLLGKSSVYLSDFLLIQLMFFYNLRRVTLCTEQVKY